MTLQQCDWSVAMIVYDVLGTTQILQYQTNCKWKPVNKHRELTPPVYDQL